MRCVYCLGQRQMRADQILLRGNEFYLCAPRGQLVEGYLVIAPYSCVGCLATLPPASFGEIGEHLALVRRFFADAYGVEQPIVYEQGRAGGGTTAAESGFPLHAHLCCLPLSIDI